MTHGERVSVAGSAVVLLALLVAGVFASRWREETRESLRAIAEAQHAMPAMTLSFDWTTPVGVQHLVTPSDPGESFEHLWERHNQHIRLALENR